MAQKTDPDLQIERAVIENETVTGANTTERVGDMFENIIDSKININNTANNVADPTNDQDVATKKYVDDNGGHVIEDEGTPLTQRADLNFVGAGVTAADAGGKTVVTIPGASLADGDKGDITVSSSGTVWTIDNGVVTAAKLATAVDPIGVQDFFIPASAFWQRSTSGCAPLARREIVTSLVNIQSLNFDQTLQEFAQVSFRLPKKYNLGTFTYEVQWTAASGSGTVQWGVSGGAYSNDDPLTATLGTAITVDDTLTAADDLDITPTSAAVTFAGTPAVGDFFVLQVSRNPASDTLTADAEFLGISLHVTAAAANDN